MTSKLVVPETVQLTQVGADPATVAGHAQVYAKDVGGVAQLFMRAGDGAISQVGSGSGTFSPPERWSQVNIAASQSGIPLSAQVSGNTNTIRMATSGSVVSLATQLTEAITAGTLTVTVTKNGSPMTLSIVHTSGSGSQATQAVGVDTYMAGDFLGIQLTTDAGFLPITNDIEAWIQCSEAVAGAPGSTIMVIGGTVTGSTDGSVFFANGGALSQDNSNLYYDVVNKRFGVGTNSPSTILDIAGTGNTAAIALRGGASAAVSAASTARLRFNQGTNRLQVSENGGAYTDIQTGASFTLDIGDAIGSSTVGSVLFVGTGNVLQQDNTNFFWDDTNNRLCVRSTSGTHALNVFGGTDGLNVRIQSSSSGHNSAYDIYDSSNVPRTIFGFANSASGDTQLQNKGYIWHSTATDLALIGNTTASPRWDLVLNASTGAATFGASTITKTGFLHEFTKDAANGLTISSYGTSVNPELMLYHGRGTATTTTPLLSTDLLGQIAFTGATTATGFFSGGIVRALATENWSSGNVGTKIEVYTTANALGGAGRLLRQTIDQDGVIYVEGGGLISKASSSAAGFFNTAMFTAGGASTSFTQADRELRIQQGANAGGQRYQYLTFNGRWSGNIDSPTLTQGNFDRVSGIEFAAAADSLGPNPNSSINFFVNTGAKSTGSEAVVTPTRAMTITYTARVGIGTTDPSEQFHVHKTSAGAVGALIRHATASNAAFLEVQDGDVKRVRLQANAGGGNPFVGTISNHPLGILVNNTYQGAFFNDGTMVLGAQTLTKPSTGGWFSELTKNTSNSLAISAYGTTSEPSIFTHRGRGTAAASTAVLSGDVIGNIWFTGATGSGDTNAGGAYIRALATENWVTGTNIGTKIEVYTALTGSFTSGRLKRMTIENDGAWTLTNSATAAISAASELKLRYNTTGHRLQISANAGSYLDVPVLAAALTTGSVLFAGSTGNVVQDNPNFFWDDTNNRLGIGTAAPATTLQVFGPGMVNALGLTQPTFETNLTAQFTVAQSSGNWGIACARASGADIAGAHLTLFKTRSTDPSVKTALVNGDTLGDIMFMGVDAANAVQRTAAIAAIINGTVGVGSVPTDIRFDTGVAGPPTERLRITSTGEIRIASLTTGSILFTGTSGAILQDNANFFWDDTNNTLGVGTASPLTNYRISVTTVTGGSGIQITGANTASYSGLDFYDSSAVFAGAVGYGNSTVAITHVQGKLFHYSAAADWVFANATRNEITLGMTSGSTFIEMQSGVSAAVSSTNTGRLRYNTFGPALQLSLNAGTYYTIPQLETSLGNGSILFGASGRINQDSANLFWDDTNNRLGVGNAAPAQALHVTGTGRFTAGIILDTLTTGSILFAAASGAISHDNANLFWDDTNDRLGIGTAAPGVPLDVSSGTTVAAIALRAGSTAAVSTSNTGRVRYDESSQKFQISKNTAAYEDVASLATAQTFTKSQNVAAVALTDAANIATDASLGNIFTVTLAGNRTLDNPTNLVSGGVYRWIVTQDATGSRTLAYGTMFKWPGGTAPTLTTAANAVDTIEAVYNGTVLLATFALNYS